MTKTLTPKRLLSDLRGLIAEARQDVAQQAAEKCLKAYLALNKIDFPYVHNLAALVEMCKSRDDSFAAIMKPAQLLTPYAVEARYDEDFWPDLETTREAVVQATIVRDFILDRLPETLRMSLALSRE